MQTAEKDELERLINTTIDARLGRWFIGGGLALFAALIAQWFILTGKVTAIDYKVTQNQERIENALTQDQAALIIQRVDQLNDTIKAVDQRLRAAGI